MTKTQQRLTWADLAPDEKEFLSLFRNADQELQGIIWRMLPLTLKFGLPFLEETDGPARAGDREAIKEVIQKWEAKLREEGAGPQ